MNKPNQDSPLVAAVLALQETLNEFERVGQKITMADLTADVDVEYIQKLMARFSESGERISQEVANLSIHLQEARTRAEAVTENVSRQAQVFERRRNEIGKRLEQFRLIGERIRELNLTIRQSENAETSDISALRGQLGSLIEEFQALKESARDSRMKALEKDAESLGQSLQALQARLHSLTN